MEKNWSALETHLKLSHKGTINFDWMDYSSGSLGRQVEIWDYTKHETLWTGTPEEFWALVLKGIDAVKAENAEAAKMEAEARTERGVKDAGKD